MLNKQQTTNNKQPTTNNKQPTTNNQQQTTNNKQQTTNNKQQTTNNYLFIPTSLAQTFPASTSAILAKVVSAIFFKAVSVKKA